MLYVAGQFSLLHRFRFGIKKWAILQSNDISCFQIYGETLPEMNEFIYLGIPFTANGIAFQVQAQRISSRLQRATHLFKNLGCNGGGFDPGTCLHIFNCFLRPIIEYGLALCPPSVEKICQTALSTSLRIITSGGRTSVSLLSNINLC